jgi:hypothetical protein
VYYRALPLCASVLAADEVTSQGAANFICVLPGAGAATSEPPEDFAVRLADGPAAAVEEDGCLSGEAQVAAGGYWGYMSMGDYGQDGQATMQDVARANADVSCQPLCLQVAGRLAAVVLVSVRCGRRCPSQRVVSQLSCKASGSAAEEACSPACSCSDVSASVVQQLSPCPALPAGHLPLPRRPHRKRQRHH